VLLNPTTTPSTPAGSGPAAFVTTRWTVVLSARDPRSPHADTALETLCRAYWYPLYAYTRRLGHAPADAQDLTQEFFSRLLEKEWLASVDREKGRFRTFLLVALKRFLANERRRVSRQKRGGDVAHLPLNTEIAENRYLAEPPLELPIDRLYERRWALTMLERTMDRLRDEFGHAGKAAEFARLKQFLATDKSAIAYAEIARDLGLTEGAARVAVHRLRRRFREIFREETAHTVAAAEDVDEELRHLLSAMAE
jgi:RNA polymerase sigma-70 factor (ECF subfamily)